MVLTELWPGIHGEADKVSFRRQICDAPLSTAFPLIFTTAHKLVKKCNWDNDLSHLKDMD